MDMENGHHDAKRQRLNSDASWQSHTVDNRLSELKLPPLARTSPGQQPTYSQPARTQSSPRPHYPEGGNIYNDKTLPPPMPESRPSMSSYSVKRESDITHDSPQYRPTPSQQFSSTRPDENSHHRSPPSYNNVPSYEKPNGPGVLPYHNDRTAPGMPPTLNIGNVRASFDSRYAQSPDAVVSADGLLYSPNPYGVPPANHSGKKKAQRASQACDSCRSLKAKCDESKPCQSCKDKGIDCTYRQPEPKAQDKIQSEMSNNIKAILEGVTKMRDDINELNKRIQQLEQPYQTPNASSVVLKTEEIEHGSDNGDPSSEQSDNSHHAEGAAMLPLKPTANLNLDSAASSPEAASDEEMAPPLNPKKPKFGIQHTTGAVELLTWKAIADLVNDEVKDSKVSKGKGALTDRYLWRAEKKRAEIRTHGYGEGPERRTSREYDVDGSDGQASGSEASSPYSEPAYGRIATSSPHQLPGYSLGRKAEREQAGGLGPDGTLDLSEATVKRLVKSYMNRMNVLHPILSWIEVKGLVKNFLREVKPTPDAEGTRDKKMSAKSAPFVGQSGSINSVLGKHSRSTPERGESSSGLETRQLPQRSPSNAVVLLMLGLGKICEAKEVPEITWGKDNMTPAEIKKVKGSTSPDHSSPSSPASSAEHTSPTGLYNRFPEVDQSSFSGKRRPLKNQDVIPGMAYVSIATDIIGNQLSGSTLTHVQANILAALYFGQLVRPVQSHSYLHVASRAIQDQIRLKSSLTSLPKDNIQCLSQDNPLVYAFWTCLQLECDIVAELACVHSGILGYEEVMPYPNTQASIKDYEMDRDVAWSYDAQLWLRKHLNDIHAHYSPQDPNSSFHLFTDKKQQPTQFSSIEAVELARTDQFGHNKYINGAIWPTLTWNFDDPEPELAKDILNARTRAKFYGARVITYRPFVETILDYSWMLQHPNESSNQRADPPTANVADGITNVELRGTPKNFEGPEDAPIEEKIRFCYGEAHLRYFEMGISALINSTRAFYGMDSPRLIVTNVFGTVHAQWGNVLVLLAVYNDVYLRAVLMQRIPKEEFRDLVKRTFDFLKAVARRDSGLQTDIKILKAAALKANVLTREEMSTTPSPRASFY